MFIFTRNCPSCCTTGQVWKRKPRVCVCPTCATIFGEFGVIAEGNENGGKLNGQAE